MDPKSRCQSTTSEKLSTTSTTPQTRRASITTLTRFDSSIRWRFTNKRMRSVPRIRCPTISSSPSKTGTSRNRLLVCCRRWSQTISTTDTLLSSRDKSSLVMRCRQLLFTSGTQLFQSTKAFLTTKGLSKHCSTKSWRTGWSSKRSFKSLLTFTSSYPSILKEIRTKVRVCTMFLTQTWEVPSKTKRSCSKNSRTPMTGSI